MTTLKKTPLQASNTVTPIVPEQKFAGPTFNVQSHRITSDKDLHLKTKGAFKIRIQNKGQVGIKIFGNFELPSYADETFETGDTALGFSSDTPVEYEPHHASDTVNIITTVYYR